MIDILYNDIQYLKTNMLGEWPLVTPSGSNFDGCVNSKTEKILGWYRLLLLSL